MSSAGLYNRTGFCLKKKSANTDSKKNWLNTDSKKNRLSRVTDFRLKKFLYK